MIIPVPFIFEREGLTSKRERLRLKRISKLNRIKVPTIEEENEKRVLIGYPHLLEIVKERCPKCNGKMWHDNFQKVWDYRKYKFPHLKACYQCVKCKYRVLFDLSTNKFDKKPFGENQKLRNS